MATSTKTTSLAQNNSIFGRKSWSNLTNLYSADNVYTSFEHISTLGDAIMGVPSFPLVLTGFDHNIPTNARIDGIQVKVTRKATIVSGISNQNDYSVFIFKDNNNIEDIESARTFYDQFTDVISTNIENHTPDIGDSWDIKDSGIWQIVSGGYLEHSSAGSSRVGTDIGASNFRLNLDLTMGVTTSGGSSYSITALRFRTDGTDQNYIELSLSSENVAKITYRVNGGPIVEAASETFIVNQGQTYEVIINYIDSSVHVEIPNLFSFTADTGILGALSSFTGFELVGELVGSIIQGNRFNNLSVYNYDDISGSVNNKAQGDWSSSQETFVYGSSLDKWGKVWTPEEINSPNFGVAISVVSDNYTSEIDLVQTTVYYETEDGVQDYVFADFQINSQLIGNSSQRCAIIDDNPERVVWMVTQNTLSGDLILSTIYANDGIDDVSPEEISGMLPFEFPFINTETVLATSIDPNVEFSEPTIAVGNGLIVVIYKVTGTAPNTDIILFKTIASNQFSTLSGLSSPTTLEFSNTSTLFNPTIDIGPDGIIHAAWIERTPVDSTFSCRIRYINTGTATVETVYTAETGAELDEITLIADKNNFIHVLSKLSLSWTGNSTIIHAKKNWVSTPSGGWIGKNIFNDVSIASMSGLSAVLDEFNLFWISYLANTPNKIQLTQYNHNTDYIVTTELPPARGDSANYASMSIDEDNNPHLVWTETFVDDRFFHADTSSLFADQMKILDTSSEIGGFQSIKINLDATKPVTFFGAPAVNVFGKQTYRSILTSSPRFLASTLSIDDVEYVSYSVLPLNIGFVFGSGGMLYGGSALVTNSESKVGIGGALISPVISDIGDIFREYGSGGANVGGETKEGLEFFESASSGAILNGRVINNGWGYIVDDLVSYIVISGESLVEQGDLPLGIERSFELSDLIFVYSGGQVNHDASLSIGGDASVYEIVGSFNNLFSDVTPSQASSGYTDYRAFYIFNNHPTDTVYNMKIYIVEDATGGSNIQVGIDSRDELQNITIDQNITSGNFRIQYEPNNPNGAGAVTVNYDPDLSVWASNLENALNGIRDLKDVSVTGSALSEGASFDVLFTGQDGKRSQSILAITQNNLNPPSTINVSRQVSGKPINSVATSLDVVTTPPTGVSFSFPTSSSPIILPKLREGEGFAVWLKRITTSNSTALENDGFVLRVSVEPIEP